MTAILIGAVVVLAGAPGFAFAVRATRSRQDAGVRSTVPFGAERPRILFPFVASSLSRGALDAALRLACAENATLIPVLLARVPLTLPLDAPLPRQSQIAIPLQEAIEHRAALFRVPVDARIERGRTNRHALGQTIAHERYDRLLVAAATAGGQLGFGADDVAWLLNNAPGDILVLRPGAEDRLVPGGSPSTPRIDRTDEIETACPGGLAVLSGPEPPCRL
jgi:hypothetical protein